MAKLMNNQLALPEFKVLCIDIDKLLKSTEHDTETVRTLMTDVLMAQDFQDLNRPSYS